ncbi:MAG: hypothetical protein IJT94_11005 [Oscillibacter sp.]|nr:hypothetical protein [Oscillibacter sp.]
MREILFRGKRRDHCGWCQGAYINVFEPEIVGNHGWLRVDPETIGQYTGMMDWNGQQIFEGDIVKGGNQYNESHCGTVSFGRYRNWVSDDSYNTGFFIKWADCKHWREELAYWVEERKIEVIGNIHDAPELLKEAVQ